MVMMTTQNFSQNNENGGASTIGSILAIFLVGGVGAVLYMVLDKFNQLFVGLSADATNTINTLEIAFGVTFVLFLIAVIINNWLNEKSEQNQGV
jgi:hypothetical protein